MPRCARSCAVGRRSLAGARPDRRGSAASRGYGHKWRQARLGHLRSHPLCAKCLKQNLTTAATVVDHVIPHKGDMELFWDRTNWQSLCEPHHSGTKQAEEKRGRVIGCDLDGRPLDPNHPWSKAKPAGA